MGNTLGNAEILPYVQTRLARWVASLVPLPISRPIRRTGSYLYPAYQSNHREIHQNNPSTWDGQAAVVIAWSGVIFSLILDHPQGLADDLDELDPFVKR